MRVVCPSCAAMYEVPEAALNRRVRCGRCSNEWIAHAAVAMLRGPDGPLPAARPGSGPRLALPGPATATPPPPAAFDAAEPEADDTAMDRLMSAASGASARRASRVAAMLWAASALVLIGAGLGGYLERDSIMRAWPPSARLYAAIGLPQGDR